MKATARHRTARAATLWLGLILAVPVAAQPGEIAAQGDGYEQGIYGRVRYQINGLTVRRGELTQQPLAGTNSPVFPGDTVLTDYDQRAEIELAGGSLVRVDRGSEVTFLALPDPYAELRDNTVLQLPVGTLRIATLLGEGEEFRVDTPAGSVYLLGDGDFRIEVDTDGRTRVVSRRGVVEVVGTSGSVLVRGGMWTELWPDALPAQPEPFNTFASDGFDRWIEEREAAYRLSDRYADGPYESSRQVYGSLPVEVRPYYRELSVYGRWTYVDDYGYVWYPRGAAVDWRPYYDGYWHYGPHGYFWVSAEPWGWAPYHYGRWARVAGYGWCWVPGRVFGGAWVAWSWGALHVGWAPLGFWNRPVVYGPVYYGYYDPHCWTFVRYTHFNRHHQHVYAERVAVHDVDGELRGAVIVTRPPRVDPDRLATSDDAREHALREVREARETRVLTARLESGNRDGFRDTETRWLRQRPAARVAMSPESGSPTLESYGDGAATPSATAGRRAADRDGDLGRRTAAPTRSSERVGGREGQDRRTVAPDAYGTRQREPQPGSEPPGTVRRRETVYVPRPTRDTPADSWQRRESAPDDDPVRSLTRGSRSLQETDPRSIYRRMAEPPTPKRATPAPSGSRGGERREKAAPSERRERSTPEPSTRRNDSRRQESSSGSSRSSGSRSKDNSGTRAKDGKRR